MNPEKRKKMLFLVVIVALIIVAGTFVMLLSNSSDHTQKNRFADNGLNGNTENGNGGDDTTSDYVPEYDADVAGLVNTLDIGSWVNLSSSIHSALRNLEGVEGLYSLSGSIEDLNGGLKDMFWIGTKGWITMNIYDPAYTPNRWGELLYTTDGGITFERIVTPCVFNCIYMVSSDEGYAGSQENKIFRTIDGGKTWTLLFPLTGGPVLDITFPPNSTVGYCSGWEGAVHRITSTGIEKMTTNWVSDMYSICFPNAEEGWVAGSGVIRYYNNGSWQHTGKYSGGFYHMSIFMLDNKTGWVGGQEAYKDKYYGGAIGHTTDGMTWKKQYNPWSIVYSPDFSIYPYRPTGILDVFFFDEHEGWAVGSFGIILHTFDGGTTWTKEADGLTPNMELVLKVFGVHTNCVYFLGQKYNLWKYSPQV